MANKKKGKKVSEKQNKNIDVSKKAIGKKKSRKKKIMISVLMIIFVLGLGYFVMSKRMQTQAEERRVAMQEQTEIMIEHWKEEGLTDEEIQEKMTEYRQESFQREEPNALTRLFFMARRATGVSGRPGGQGTGEGMRPSGK